MIKEEIKKIIKESCNNLVKAGKIKKDFLDFNIKVESAGKDEFGDYTARVYKIEEKRLDEIGEFHSGGNFSPETCKIIKEKIEKHLKFAKFFEKIEFVFPIFFNFFLSEEYLQKQIAEILEKKEKFSCLNIGRKKKINIEFISANPTGPLTLGNGRGGFGGDVLANVLEKAGYDITREYYINDRGKQIENLKKGLYRDEKRTAAQIQKKNQEVIVKKLKIKFDIWFSEKTLYKNKEVDKILAYLKKKKLTYEKDGALWFKTTKFGDDKDRVLIKKDGEKTYFASDIAYLKNKIKRGFDKLIILLGADHYGYIARMKAAVEALGYDKSQLDFITFQLVHLLENGKEVRMSKRAGFFVTLEELIGEVGLDAARFFFLQRSADTHLNFDLDLAKEKSEKNPVYYIQYAYARIQSIINKLKTPVFVKASAGKQKTKVKTTTQNSKLLKEPSELDLIKQLIRFPEIVEDAAKDYQVQRIPQYAFDLAESFHRFYQEIKVISKDRELTRARLALILAVQIVLKNTLDLMGISAPSKM